MEMNYIKYYVSLQYEETDLQFLCHPLEHMVHSRLYVSCNDL